MSGLTPLWWLSAPRTGAIVRSVPFHRHLLSDSGPWRTWQAWLLHCHGAKRGHITGCREGRGLRARVAGPACSGREALLQRRWPLLWAAGGRPERSRIWQGPRPPPLMVQLCGTPRPPCAPASLVSRAPLPAAIPPSCPGLLPPRPASVLTPYSLWLPPPVPLLLTAGAPSPVSMAGSCLFPSEM